MSIHSASVDIQWRNAFLHQDQLKEMFRNEKHYDSTSGSDKSPIRCSDCNTSIKGLRLKCESCKMYDFFVIASRRIGHLVITA